MEVQFRPLRYKHQLAAKELKTKLLTGEATKQDLIEFIAPLVQSWDLVDVETGQPIPVSDIGELTLPQIDVLLCQFGEKMQELGIGVKKKNGET